jgi:BASS family bile acid:Na+ symporter
MHPIDSVALNFSATSLTALNIILGIIMFGVALDLSIDDFKRALKMPRAPILGMLAQFLLMPAATFGLMTVLDPTPSVGLGMIMVASCPGGNISNFITHVGRGDTALSVTMTALSTVGAIFMTPLNVAFWGSMDPGTAAVLTEFQLDPLGMFGNVLVLLGVPLILGMTVAAKAPGAAEKMRKPFKVMSLAFFFVFILVAFRSNFDFFLQYIGYVFVPVLLQNALSLTTGYTLARIGRLEGAQARAVAIEVGIQNSGLGLILIFGFFGGLGGMAVIAAWWGIWHIIAGLSLAGVWTWWDKRNGIERETATT